MTQNLLASAARAVSPTGTPTRTSIEDLASVINTIALYDGLVVLGKPYVWQEYAEQSTLIRAIDRAGLLEVRDLDSATIELVAAHSRLHLASATKQENFPAIEQFLEVAYLQRLCHSSIGFKPDGATDLDAGKEWIATAPAGKDFDQLLKAEMTDGYARGAFLYVRTFFYVAYMGIANLDFTADRIRAKVIEEISNRQRNFQEEMVATFPKDLIEQLTKSFSDALRIERLSGWLSPFAATVFHNALGNPKRIPEEIIALRDRVGNARRELFELETGFRYGPQATEITALGLAGRSRASSFKEGQRARHAYEHARDELLASFGPVGHDVQHKTTVTFPSAVFAALLDAKNPEKWLNLLERMPIESIKRFLSQRRLAEIHRLRDDLPASAEMLREIDELFPGALRRGES